jgi:hypothetical protein
MPTTRGTVGTGWTSVTVPSGSTVNGPILTGANRVTIQPM